MTAPCPTPSPTCLNMDNTQLTLRYRLSAQDDEKQHIQKYARVATIVSTYKTEAPVLSTDGFIDNAGLNVMKPDRLASDVPAPIYFAKATIRPKSSCSS